MLSTIGRFKNKSLFTRIKTVDENYPLYGEVIYEPEGAYERMQKEPNTILINESLLLQAKGTGARFKGDMTARAENIKGVANNPPKNPDKNEFLVYFKV